MRPYFIIFEIIFCLIGIGNDGYCSTSKMRIDYLMNDAGLKRIKLNNNKSFESQVTKEKTIYILEDVFDLRKKEVILPQGCCLYFKGGLLINGKLSGDFSIINTKNNKPVLKNVVLEDFVLPIKISWYVGERKVLYNNDFNCFSEGAVVDFENIPFTIIETISIASSISSLTIKNWVVNTAFPIKRWMISEASGNCWNVDNFETYKENVVWTKTVLPQNYVGYLIRIETADIVKNDDRDMSLYKGLWSVITGIEGHKVTISDHIEPFSSSRDYYRNNRKEKRASSYKIFRPLSLNLYNCKFSFSNSDACLTIDVYKSRIQDCSFEATEGAAVLFNVTGHSIDIDNCLFKDAWTYTGNNVDMAYGIQVNEGTNVNIMNCVFHDNRRSVDFSGQIESRYCMVSNCSVYQRDYIGSGSALGGHSTSFGNVYINNKIYGFYSAGIQCRGENEQIIGNEFYCRASGAMIVSGIGTKIENNKVLSENKYETDCFVFSRVDVPGNTLLVKNNIVRCRHQVVDISSLKTEVTFVNNKVELFTNSSDNQTFVFKFPPKVYLDNEIQTNSLKKVKTVEFENKK